MKGEEHQEVVLLQGVDTRPLGELQANHDRPVLKALALRACPGADVRSSVRYDGQFPLFAVAGLQADVVLVSDQLIPTKVAN